MIALAVRNLCVRYGDLVGVADVSLAVPQGAVVALIGSNGAGKTTTLNAVAGLVPVTSGSIAFQGAEIAGQPAYSVVKRGLALSPEGWRLFVGQTVEQNLRLGATTLPARARVCDAGPRVHPVPPPGRTPPAARRHAVGRGAPDAGDGARADVRPPHAAAGRAEPRPGARRQRCRRRCPGGERQMLAMAARADVYEQSCPHRPTQFSSRAKLLDEPSLGSWRQTPW